MYAVLGLIALALGYKVFVDAGKEKEGVKLLGQVIGIFVMIAAVLSILCGTMKCMTKYGKYDCPTKSFVKYAPQSPMDCPMGGK